MKKMILFCIAIVLAGCSNHSEQPLELNEGKKWKVNEEMMVHLRNAEEAIETFQFEDGDAVALGGQLQEDLNLLIKSCTMKGPAHDELHKWLLPYIKTVKTLSKSDGESDSTDQVKELKNHFKQFNQFFE